MQTRLISCAALAGALALPAGAQAAGIVTGPVKVKSYNMTISANDAPSGDSLSISFLRTSGKSTQMHSYSFDQGVKVTSTQISGSLGKYGKLKLKLGKTKSVKGTVPKGCTGTLGKARSGTLTGDFRFTADTTYFKTVKRKKFTATALSGSSTIKCEGNGNGDGNGGGGNAGPRLTLSKFGEGNGGSFSFTASPQAQTAMQTDAAAATAPATVMHMISTTGNGLTTVTETSATVPGLTPFITGQGDFAGESMGTMAMGPLTGSLVAKFDSIGDIALTGDTAMLMR